MRVLSFGGGVQTTALAVLLVSGEIPDVDHIVMADTGGETPETYRHVDAVRRYLIGHGRTIEIVRFRDADGDEVTLEDYTLQRSTPIPVRSPDMFGRRQCTNKWKIEPVKRFARAHGAKWLAMVLGISYDEIQRMKPDRERWVEREYPLIDAQITRSDCRRIVAEAGLPDPPKSACFYCPLQNVDRLRALAVQQPELYARTVALEDAINVRRAGQGKAPAFIASNLIPLRALPTASAMLPGFDGAVEECEGVCFV